MELKYDANGLIPVIVQHSATRQVLMLGYMNEEALQVTQQEQRVTFYSRSKQRLWTKGESSGHSLEVISIRPDCDADCLLIEAWPLGPTCHTGSASCFRTPESDGFLHALESILRQRIEKRETDSYTSRLYQRGIEKIAQKVGEESVELVIEAMRNRPDLFLNEAADLLYHFLLLLQAKGISLAEVESVLWERHQQQK